LFQQSATFQRELSALQRGFSNPTAFGLTNHSVTIELDDDELDEMKKKI